MKQIEYILKTKAPIVINHNSPDNNSAASNDYIPGFNVKGALIKEFITRNNCKEIHKNKEAFEIFFNNKVIFTNAYISERENESNINFKPSSFYFKTNKEKTNYYFDPHNNIKEENVKSVNKYIRYDDNNSEPKTVIEFTTVKKGTNFHMSRKNRLKGSTEENSIFNYEYILPNQQFTGFIKGGDEAIDKIYKQFKNLNSILIGKSKNTQYGNCSISFSKVKEIKNGNIENKTFFIKFNSDAILINEFGLCDNSLKTLKEYIYEYFEKGTFDVPSNLFRANSSESYISVKGYKDALKKVVSKGSSFIIEFKNDLNEETKEKLNKMLFCGIGERTCDGFGQIELIKINETDSKKVMFEEYEKVYDNKDIDIPKNFEKIFLNILKKEIEKIVRINAIEEAEKFYRIPSNSLISRLESFLDSKDNFEGFKENISKLREKARNSKAINSLEVSKNKEKTLLNFIIDFSLDEKMSEENSEKKYQLINKATEENLLEKEISDFAKELKINKNFFKDQKNEFEKLYMFIFLRRLRKMNKERGGNDEQ